jgi:ubiquinone/menaquinone biosynthesis C-methylase UbiE
LERLSAARVERVVAVDINAAYVEQTRARYARAVKKLELYCADIQSDSLSFEPVDLIYAALLFEYVDVPATLTRLRRGCRSGGTLATLLQLAHSDHAAVSPSPFRSLELLAPAMRLIAPGDLCVSAAEAGFVAVGAETIELASGKQFWRQIFRAV